MRIPLYDRTGHVVAHALVDRVDLPTVDQHRWYLAHGYAVTTVRQQTVAMHRLLLGLSHGDGVHADHKNRNRLDNRRLNLRPGTRAQNAQNRPSNTRGSSKFRGVYWDKLHKKWAAKVRTQHLGYFDDEKEAAKVAQEWREKLMPWSVHLMNLEDV